ncbi:hypothetical protein ILUMI_19346 [Ignelater luminosus]|uniref:RNase H type-1 domain-containing protein n=1 Tax=Ignelater luminosus TaxID=2038154 RepID=A0A8K0G3B2_IGNLU|nr:hypothetical protein ILUMI_19346 [Ignelater luminosus]
MKNFHLNDIDDYYRFIKENGYTVVYVTKAWNGQNEATAVWFGNNHPLNISKFATQGPAADIQACVEAVQIAYRNDITRLMIKTDIPYVYHSMTNWIHKWRRNGWQTVNETDVRDRRDFIILDHNCELLDDIVWELIDDQEDFDCCQEAKLFARQSLPRH